MHERTLVTQFSKLVHEAFFTNKSRYAKQRSDGNYKKITSPVSYTLIASILLKQESILAYQERNGYVKWVCLDIDIDSKRIEQGINSDDFEHLLTHVKKVRDFLDSYGISHIVEFSGNRGFHVWIHLSNPISKSQAYEIVKSIYYQSDLGLEGVINVDLFPKTPSTSRTSKRVGLGVKIPLSKHAKSGCYSFICDLDNSLEISGFQVRELSTGLLLDQINRLEHIEKMRPSVIFDALGIDLEESADIHSSPVYLRVKSVEVSSEVDINSILDKLTQCHIISFLLKDYELGLPNRNREIIVGLLNRLETATDKQYGLSLLREFFSRLPNFRSDVTEKKLEQLSYYPLKCNYLRTLYPNFCEDCSKESPIDYLDDATIEYASWDFSEINAVVYSRIRSSEYWYSRTNDEITMYHNLKHIEGISFNKFSHWYQALIRGESTFQPFYYLFERNEKDKIRTLANLDPPNRVLSTACVWSLSRLFNTLKSDETYSYKIAQSFYGNHVFEPYQKTWHTFINSLKEIVNNDDFDNYSLLKIDLYRFYDSVDVDKLELMLTKEASKSIDNIVRQLAPSQQAVYNNIIHYLLSLCRAYQTNGLTGLPQGPAFARYLSELYLLDIDKIISDAVGMKDGIYLRYVDDLFIILPEANHANELSIIITSYLARHSLRINQDKTKICSILEFRNSRELEKYSEESNYNARTFASNSRILPQSGVNKYIQTIFSIVNLSNIDKDKIGVLYKNKIDSIFYKPTQKEYENFVITSSHYRGSVYKVFYDYYLSTGKEAYLDGYDEMPIGGLSMHAFIQEATKRYVENGDRRPVDELFSKIAESGDTSDIFVEAVANLAFCSGNELPEYLVKFLTIDMIRRICSSGLVLKPAASDAQRIIHIVNGVEDINMFIQDLFSFALSSKVPQELLQQTSTNIFNRVRLDQESSGRKHLDVSSSEIADCFYNIACFFSGFYLECGIDPKVCHETYEFVWKKINCIVTELSDGWIKMIEVNSDTEGKLDLSSSSVIGLFMFGRKGSELLKTSGTASLPYQRFISRLAIVFSNLEDNEKSRLIQNPPFDLSELYGTSPVMSCLLDPLKRLYPLDARMNISEFMHNSILVITDNAETEWMVCINNETHDCPDFEYLAPELLEDALFPEFRVYKYVSQSTKTKFENLLPAEIEDRTFLDQLASLAQSMESFRMKYLGAIDRYPLVYYNTSIFINTNGEYKPLVPYYFVPNALCIRPDFSIINTKENYTKLLVRTLDLKKVSIFNYYNTTEMSNIPTLGEYIFGDESWFIKNSDNWSQNLVTFLDKAKSTEYKTLIDYEKITVDQIISTLDQNQNFDCFTFLDGYLNVKETFANKFDPKDRSLSYLLFWVDEMDLLDNINSCKSRLSSFLSVFKRAVCLFDSPQDDQPFSRLFDVLSERIVSIISEFITVPSEPYRLLESFEIYRGELLDQKDDSIEYNSSRISGDDKRLHFLDLEDIDSGAIEFSEEKDYLLRELVSHKRKYILQSSDFAFVVIIPDILTKVYEIIEKRASLFVSSLKEPSSRMIYFQSFWKIRQTLEACGTNLAMALTTLENHRAPEAKPSIHTLILWLAAFNRYSLKGLDILNAYDSQYDSSHVFLHHLYPMLIAIVASHQSFTHKEANEFVDKLVNYCGDSNVNVFHYEDLTNNNGLVNIVQVMNRARDINEKISLKHFLESTAQHIVIVNDSFMSGKQLSDAVEYYSTGNVVFKKDHFWSLKDIKHEEFKDKIVNASRITILSILGTEEGKSTIRERLIALGADNDKICFDVQINLENFRFSDLQMDAPEDKKFIRDVLTDDHLYHRLFETGKVNLNTPADIDGANLVLRYRRLPSCYIKMLGVKMKYGVAAIFEHAPKTNKE
ncbi:MAG: reverse transcriptase domain-containing protein [Fermentimonas sp.]|nr:reverse transcriptase domain-containing protein [Fermentimonas sp.]